MFLPLAVAPEGGAGGGAPALVPMPVVPGGLVVDLGRGLGSLRWWRGLLTCLGLCSAMLANAPAWRVPLRPLPPVDAGEPPAPRAPSAATPPVSRAPGDDVVRLTAALGGVPLGRGLERIGVLPAEAARVAALVAEALPGGPPPDAVLEVRLGRAPGEWAPRPLERVALRARLGASIAVERDGGAFRLRREAAPLDETPLRVRGRVGSSLRDSALAAGAPRAAIDEWLRAVATREELPLLGPDDRFDMVVARRRADGAVEHGALLLAGLSQRGGTVHLLPEADGWRAVAETGAAPARGSVPPVPGGATSSFGFRRHPILGFWRFHAGVDLRAAHGTPVRAAATGMVTGAGWRGGHGLHVRLAHAGGLGSGYSHLSHLAVSAGGRVAAGQVIGFVGSTGFSTGPHLHFETYREGKAVDPRLVRFAAHAAADDEARARLRRLLTVAPERP